MSEAADTGWLNAVATQKLNSLYSAPSFVHWSSRRSLTRLLTNCFKPNSSSRSRFELDPFSLFCNKCQLCGLAIFVCSSPCARTLHPWMRNFVRHYYHTK